jgi:LDH2 family malate/lactate/ureidoglycolate dehydrogenase
MRERQQNGVPLAPAVIAQLNTLATELKLPDRLE